MKTTFIDSSTRDLYIFEQLKSTQQSCISEWVWMPFSVWCSQHVTPPCSLRIQTFLLYKKLQSCTHNFPIYGKMFGYFTFVEQIVKAASRFHHCAIYAQFLPVPAFSSLPTTTESEIELKRLIDLCLEDPHFYPSHSPLNLPTDEMNHLETTNPFLKNYFDVAAHTYLLHHGLQVTPLKSTTPSTSMYRFALNARIEIEAIAQEIITESIQASDVLIITCDASYTDLIDQVFTRYHIPFGFVNKTKLSACFTVANTLLNCYTKQDVDSLLVALQQNALNVFPSDSLMHYIKQFIFTLDQCLIPSTRIQGMNTDFINSYEYEILRKEEQEFNRFISCIKPFIEKVLTLSSPQEICNDIFNYCVDKFNAEKYAQELFQLKLVFEEVLPYLQDKQDLDFIIHCTQHISLPVTMSCIGCCAVTDMTHPLPARKRSYIVGANQKSYPGFTPESGIFDENYLARTMYPTMQERFDAYTQQVQWISKSADQIYYSFALLDYQGKKSEAALELESQVGKPTELQSIDANPVMRENHQLTPELSHALFFKDDRLHGSISSFEKHFNCPYAYFLKYGLRVSDFTYTEFAPNTIGTMQHAILEKACATYGKEYTRITKEEMWTIARPSIDFLDTYFPKQREKTKIITHKMIDNLMTSFEFLQDMEQHTSYKPDELEFKFTSDYFDHITLKGVLDRIDVSFDLLRVIDYKSSSKTLSEQSIKSGLQLQLCTYLILASQLFNKKAVGAYYYSLRNENCLIPAIVKTKSGWEDWSALHTKDAFTASHKLSGWTVQEDPTLDTSATHIKSIRMTKEGLSFTLYDMDTIEQCISALFKALVDRINDGHIQVDPIKGACTYCLYRPICRFKGEQRKAEPLVFADISFKKGRDTDEVES